MGAKQKKSLIKMFEYIRSYRSEKTWPAKVFVCDRIKTNWTYLLLINLKNIFLYNWIRNLVEVLCILLILGFVSGKKRINNIHTFFNIFSQETFSSEIFKIYCAVIQPHLLIKRANSTFHQVSRLDGTTERIQSTCCTGTDHATCKDDLKL